MENTNKIYNIMGCKETKSGNGYNVTLVHTDVDGKKKYANLYVKNARRVETDEGKKGISIFIPIFEDKKDEGKKESLVGCEDSKEVIPFTKKKKDASK